MMMPMEPTSPLERETVKRLQGMFGKPDDVEAEEDDYDTEDDEDYDEDEEED